MRDVSESVLNSPPCSDGRSQDATLEPEFERVAHAEEVGQAERFVDQAKSEVQPDSEKASRHLAFGIVALIVGFFFLGIICGPIAIYHGEKAKQFGAHTGGPIILALGVLESIFAFVTMMAIVG